MLKLTTILPLKIYKKHSAEQNNYKLFKKNIGFLAKNTSEQNSIESCPYRGQS